MPDGAEVEINSLWYKKGLGDRIYYHNGDQWIRSTLEDADFRRAKIKNNQYKRK